jgi:hypothetical protein
MRLFLYIFTFLSIFQGCFVATDPFEETTLVEYKEYTDYHF